ncbi:alpha/beta hydrolase, partial [Modestobacter sp. NPDC049651]|uniref:alpha/beta hydrolase n=1 Tax=Modestobacter sp. NPDC049651 TaxID=3155777 RepID=UPI0033D6BA51
MGLDRRSWARVLRRAGGTVVPLPGMGRRAAVGGVDALADELLGRLGEEPVVLVGHSQSCQVAVAVGARDPRVVGLLLLGPTTDPRLLRRGRLATRWARTAVHEPWWQVPLLLAQWLTTGPRRMVELWRRTSRDRTDQRLRGVTVPVVVVRGSRDALCPRDWVQQLAQLAPRGRLVELPGAAHMTPQTDPDDVVRLLRELAASAVVHARAVTVRPARPEDAAALHRVSVAAIQESAAGHYDQRQRDAWAGRRTEEGHRLLVERTRTLVAEVDGGVAGFASVALAPVGQLRAGEVDLAEMYRAVGLLQKGHLVEVDRAALVGQYVGA